MQCYCQSLAVCWSLLRKNHWTYLVHGAGDAATRRDVAHVARVVRPGTIPRHLRGDIRRRLAGLLLPGQTESD